MPAANTDAKTTDRRKWMRVFIPAFTLDIQNLDDWFKTHCNKGAGAIALSAKHHHDVTHAVTRGLQSNEQNKVAEMGPQRRPKMVLLGSIASANRQIADLRG